MSNIVQFRPVSSVNTQEIVRLSVSWSRTGKSCLNTCETYVPICSFTMVFDRNRKIAAAFFYVHLSKVLILLTPLY